MNPIGFVGGSRKAGHQVHVGRLGAHHDLRELLEDLGQSLAVPQRAGPVHGRADHEDGVAALDASHLDHLEKLAEDGLDQDRDGPGGILYAGDEISHAGQDADVALDTDGLQGLGQGDHATAGDHLGSGHHGTITATHRIEMTLDVGITNHGEDERHPRTV